MTQASDQRQKAIEVISKNVSLVFSALLCHQQSYRYLSKWLVAELLRRCPLSLWNSSLCSWDREILLRLLKYLCVGVERDKISTLWRYHSKCDTSRKYQLYMGLHFRCTSQGVMNMFLNKSFPPHLPGLLLGDDWLCPLQEKQIRHDLKGSPLPLTLS